MKVIISLYDGFYFAEAVSEAGDEGTICIMESKYELIHRLHELGIHEFEFVEDIK